MRQRDRYDKKPSPRSCQPDGNPQACHVDAVLSIDNRGQILIPKEIRNRANIRDGDKLVLVSGMNRDEICCLALKRAATSLPGTSGGTVSGRAGSRESSVSSGCSTCRG